MSALSQPLADAAAAIHASQTIVLACHVNPDGDALGSMLGLALALLPLGKIVTCLSEDGIPAILTFLPGAELVRQTTDQTGFDLALVVDSGDLPRVGSTVQPIISRARRVVGVLLSVVREILEHLIRHKPIGIAADLVAIRPETMDVEPIRDGSPKHLEEI